MTGELSLLAGQLLGISFASGLNLYATVAILGIASRLGWITGMPPALRGLEDVLVIASAAALFLVEAIIDKVSHLDSLWDALHTLIRPTAATLLAMGILAAQPPSVQIAGAVLAGLVALTAHATKAGFRLATNAASTPVGTGKVSVAEDVIALALPVAALRYPEATLLVAGVSLAAVALFGARLWRAFALGLRALVANLRGFFGQARWRPLDEVPARLRALLEPPRLGGGTPRAARAALHGARGAGGYRNGWLVITGNSAVFLYRSFFRPRRITLPAARTVQVRRGLWADALELETERFRCTLFLLKDGPSAELARADFTHAAP